MFLLSKMVLQLLLNCHAREPHVCRSGANVSWEKLQNTIVKITKMANSSYLFRFDWNRRKMYEIVHSRRVIHLGFGSNFLFWMLSSSMCRFKLKFWMKTTRIYSIKILRISPRFSMRQQCTISKISCRYSQLERTPPSIFWMFQS